MTKPDKTVFLLLLAVFSHASADSSWWPDFLPKVSDLSWIGDAATELTNVISELNTQQSQDTSTSHYESSDHHLQSDLHQVELKTTKNLSEAESKGAAPREDDGQFARSVSGTEKRIDPWQDVYQEDFSSTSAAGDESYLPSISSSYSNSPAAADVDTEEPLENGLASGGGVDRKEEARLLSIFSIVNFKNSACNGRSGMVGTCFSTGDCLVRSGTFDGQCASGKKKPVDSFHETGGLLF